MKKTSVLIVFLIFSSGCSTYQATNYEILPSRGLAVIGDNGEQLPESKLTGRHCRIELRDGSTAEGKIQKTDHQSVTLVKEKPHSAWEKASSVTTVVPKTEISNFTLKSPSDTGTHMAFLGVAAIGLLVLLVEGMSHYQ